MRTTVTLDDSLLEKASELYGRVDNSSLIREGLRALIERESARRLSKLGGTDRKAQQAPRRREIA